MHILCRSVVPNCDRLTRYERNTSWLAERDLGQLRNGVRDWQTSLGKKRVNRFIQDFRDIRFFRRAQIYRHVKEQILLTIDRCYRLYIYVLYKLQSVGDSHSTLTSLGENVRRQLSRESTRKHKRKNLDSPTRSVDYFSAWKGLDDSKEIRKETFSTRHYRHILVKR